MSHIFKPINILSLGVGVQSSTMALMAAERELPMPDAAIFADTMDEPKAVYEHLEWLKMVLPFPIYTVCKGDLMEESLRVARSKKSGLLYIKGNIPAYVLNEDGTKGLLGRKCTADFKIEPIKRKCREIAGLEYLQWRRMYRRQIGDNSFSVKMNKRKDLDAWNEMQDNALVVCWIGISKDEADRAKPSREPWMRSEWPLLEKRMTRIDCLEWLKKKGYPEPPRSACKKCPFHSDLEWSIQTPEDFQESIEWERKLQAQAQDVLKGVPYLHESCVPLDQVDFSKLKVEGHAQLNKFSNECEGLCGV